MLSPRVPAFVLAAIIGAISLGANPASQVLAARPVPPDSAQVILQRYADAWRGAKEMEVPERLVLAFAVHGDQGGEYALDLSNTPGGTVRPEASDKYDIRFEVDIDFLRRLDRGEMSALTAMGQARSSDPIPLKPSFGPDFGKRPEASLLFRRLAFHFWNREWPEITPFSESAARVVHGGNAAVFVYDRQFRSAWYQLKPGMHINANVKDQTNSFPQLIIATRGQFSARLDGHKLILSEGQAVFIPAGMPHEFWAEAGQYGELIWTAFGEGA